MRAWRPIDDRVMGGISRSILRHDPAGHAVFERVVSLEQNGGFASVRSTTVNFGMWGAHSRVIEVRGDGKRFKISLLADDGFDNLNYPAGLIPSGHDWQAVRLPSANARASFRGREVTGAPPLDPAQVHQVGLLIGDRQAGAFALSIRRIRLE